MLNDLNNELKKSISEKDDIIESGIRKVEERGRQVIKKIFDGLRDMMVRIDSGFDVPPSDPPTMESLYNMARLLEQKFNGLNGKINALEEAKRSLD